MNMNILLNISSNSPGNKTNVFSSLGRGRLFTTEAEGGQMPSSALKTCSLFEWQEHLKMIAFSIYIYIHKCLGFN